MAANSNNNHSQPIPIASQHSRYRSDSYSDDSDDSASPPSPLTSPIAGIPPRVAPVSPSTSPILSYFLAQSPSSKSPAATFPFRRNFGAPVIQDDEDASDGDRSSSHHARRASTAWVAPERFPPQSPAVLPTNQQDRASGLLRRLSLGGAMARPQLSTLKPAGAADGSQPARGADAPPNTPVVPTTRKVRRATTLAQGTPRPQRAPSPMGERILKGHFDGFN